MTSSHAHLIIDSARLPFWVRLVNIVLTIAIWFSYLYLIQESFAFAHDVGQWTFNGFDDAAKYPSFAILPTIAIYALVVVIFAAVYIGWALYNQLRFRGRNQRKFSPPLTIDELAEMYHIPPTDLEKWQKGKNLVMYHDETGRLMTIDAAAA